MDESKLQYKWYKDDFCCINVAKTIAGRALDDHELLNHINNADWNDISIIQEHPLTRRLLNGSGSHGLYVPDLMLLVKAQLTPH